MVGDSPDRNWLTVVIATRNPNYRLHKAISSVLGQSEPSVNLIVVDDGSSPAVSLTCAHVTAGAQLIRLPGNGVSAARNAGLAHADAEWVAFLDDDDELLAGWSQLVAGLVEDRTGVVCVGARLVDEEGVEIRALAPDNLSPLFGNVVGLFLTGTWAARRNALLAIGGYDELLTFSENTDLAIRLVKWIEESHLECRSSPGFGLQIERRTAENRRSNASDLYDSSCRLLRKHEAAFEVCRSEAAAIHAIAGVNAARLDKLAEARYHFRRAVQLAPSRTANWARLMISMSRRASMRTWVR